MFPPKIGEHFPNPQTTARPGETIPCMDTSSSPAELPRPDAVDHAIDRAVSSWPGKLIRADELQLGDDVLLHVQAHDGSGLEAQPAWFTVWSLRQGLAVFDKDGIEHPAIHVDVYRWGIHRDAILIPHHRVRVRRPRETGPAATVELPPQRSTPGVNSSLAFGPHPGRG